MDSVKSLLEMLGAKSPVTGAGPWVVAASGLGTLLTEADIQVLSRVCSVRTYRKGDRIYRCGDAADELFVLLDGHVKISAPTRLRGERIVAVCGPDDFFGEAFLTGAVTRVSDAISLTEGALVCPISRANFLEVARQAPSVVLAFTTTLAGHAQALQARLEVLRLPAPARLARTLLNLAERLGQDSENGWRDLHVNLKHEELADIANVSRVTVTEHLSAWRSQALVLGTRGHYSVHMADLEMWAEQLEVEAVRW
ncbi:Crp/Fnr family transcriptional regulator [Deinococcus oregonensis]|uniref:Crp/Fnr family transcriptional regulator n=1 Tax=Deinococcus oregonensis TaxID=1805970 RepID=A0ABV6AYS6_9DEIO